jgi:hypothetical protein
VAETDSAADSEVLAEEASAARSNILLTVDRLGVAGDALEHIRVVGARGRFNSALPAVNEV